MSELGSPFWIPIIIRHLIFRVPPKGTIILTTTHIDIFVCLSGLGAFSDLQASGGWDLRAHRDLRVSRVLGLRVWGLGLGFRARV